MAKRYSTGGGDGRAIPGVTAENYIIPADDFTRATGKAMEYARTAGKCFMITPDMLEHRAVWKKYFSLKGMGARNKQMRWWLEKQDKYTQRYAVPAEWPWQFDQSVSEAMCR